MTHSVIISWGVRMQIITSRMVLSFLMPTRLKLIELDPENIVRVLYMTVFKELE